jgi:hypothetical protein
MVLSSKSRTPQSRILVIISEKNGIEEELNQYGSTFFEYVSEVQATTREDLLSLVTEFVDL